MSLVTPSGHRKLTSELESLRAKRAARLRGPGTGAQGEAGGFSADVVDGNALGGLERQIAVIEDMLAHATVVHPDPVDGELGVGELVRVRDLDTGELVEYRIVGVGEADPAAGSISYTSPVGSALLGRQVGELVEVEVPSGVLRLEIVGIES